MSIPVAARFKDWVCGRSLVGIVGSNPAEGMDVCLLWVLRVVKERSLCRADHLSRGVLTSVACLNVVVKPGWWWGPGPLGAVAQWWGGGSLQYLTKNAFNENLMSSSYQRDISGSLINQLTEVRERERNENKHIWLQNSCHCTTE